MLGKGLLSVKGEKDVRKTFFGNDLIGAIFHAIKYLFHGRIMIVVSAQLAEIVDWKSAYSGVAPRCKFAVTMFSYDIGMNASTVHPQMFSQFIPESGRI